MTNFKFKMMVPIDDQLVAPPVEPLSPVGESDSESDAEGAYVCNCCLLCMSCLRLIGLSNDCRYSHKLINSVNPKGQLGRYYLRIHVRED